MPMGWKKVGYVFIAHRSAEPSGGVIHLGALLLGGLPPYPLGVTPPHPLGVTPPHPRIG